MGPERDNNFSERLAKGIARGILISVFGFIGICFALSLALTALRNMTGANMDDSDRDAWHRSGMTVRTDALTGRQYLETSAGHLVPRLGANGLQVVMERKP